MAAPAGVNEGIPQDPVAAGGAGLEVAEAPPAGADTTGEADAQAEPADTVRAETAEARTARAEAKPAAVIPAGTVPAPAEPVGEGLVGAPGGKPAEANLAETAPAKTGPAADDSGEPEPTDAELADAGPADAGPADAGHAEAGPADAGHAEAGADGPDWDAGEETRDVSPLAVIGMIVGVIALVGVAVGILAVITHGFRPKTVITYRPAAVFRLRAGQCVNSGTNALSVTVVSCATPHDAEVFAVFRLPDMAWPGASAIQQGAGSGCQSRLNGYLNPELATADLTQEYVYPNQAAWQAGEHTVVCEVRAVSGPLTGSVHAPR